jgi:acyl carrier protein
MVQQRLQEVFQQVFANDDLQVDDSTTADDVPGWDSLAHINLMFAVENEFGIQIADDRLGSFADVGELRRYVEERVAGAA